MIRNAEPTEPTPVDGLVLTVHNPYPTFAGAPPAIVKRSGDGRYAAYIEIPRGTLWTFEFDPKTQRGIIRGGETWDRTSRIVRDQLHYSPFVHDLTGDVFTWLRICYRAATGRQLRKSGMDEMLDLVREGEGRQTLTDVDPKVVLRELLDRTGAAGHEVMLYTAGLTLELVEHCDRQDLERVKQVLAELHVRRPDDAPPSTGDEGSAPPDDDPAGDAAE